MESTGNPEKKLIMDNNSTKESPAKSDNRNQWANKRELNFFQFRFCLKKKREREKKSLRQ